MEERSHLKYHQQRKTIRRGRMFRKLLARKKLRAAKISFSEKRFEEALAYADKILKNDPRNLKAMLFRTRALERIRNYDLVKEMVDSIIDSHGDDDDAMFQLARLSYNTGEYQKCEELCSLILGRTKGHQSKLLLARTLAKLNRKSLSLAMMDELVLENPSEIDTFTWATKVAYEMRDVARMKRYLDSLTELTGETEITTELRKKFNRISLKEYAIALPGVTLNETELIIDFIKTALDNKLYRIALEVSSDIAVQQANNKRFMSIYAEAILQNNKTDVARALLDSNSLDHDPIMTSRLMIICGRYDEALELLNSRIKEEDMQSNIHRLLSLVYSRKKNLKKAIEHNRAALKINKKDTISRHRLFVNLIQSNHLEELEIEWENVLSCLKEDKSMLETAWYLALKFSNVNWISDITDGFLSKDSSSESINTSFQCCMKHGRLDLALKYLDLLQQSNLDRDLFNSCKLKLNKLLSNCEIDEDKLRNLSNSGEVYTTELLISAICNEARKTATTSFWWEKDPVVHITSTLGKGGAEKQLIELACKMKSDNPEREVIILLASAENPTNDRLKIERAEDAGIKIMSFDSGHLIDNPDSHVALGKYYSKVHSLPNDAHINKIENIVMLLKKIKPGIVHSWQDQTNLLTGVASTIVGISRTILSCRSLPPIDKGLNHSRNNVGLISAYLEYSKDPRISIVHNSAEGMARYKQLMEKNSDSVHMMVNGNITSVPNTDSTINTNKDVLKIGGVFRLTPEKNPLMWIDVAERVLEQYSTGIEFVLVGGGSMLDQVSERIEQSPYKENIETVGMIDDVSKMYSEFDLLLHVSDIEGLPNVILESQAHGVPVICTDAGGSKSAFIPSISGKLIEIGNIDGAVQALISAIDDVEWRKNASLAGIEYIKQSFSANKIFNNWISIYRNEEAIGVD